MHIHEMLDIMDQVFMYTVIILACSYPLPWDLIYSSCVYMYVLVCVSVALSVCMYDNYC